MTFGNLALAESEGGVEIPVDIEIKTFKEIDRRLQDYEVLKEMEKAKDQRIENLEKENLLLQKELELEKRENEINKRIQDVMKQEIEAKDRSFQDMKEIADRAIKLAEGSKKGSGNWQYLGLAVIVAEVVRIVIAR